MIIPAFLLLRKLTRFMSHLPVLRRFSEYIQRQFSALNTPFLVKDFDGNLSVKCYLDSHISSAIFWYGAYSKEQIPFLKKYLQDDFVFLDIGANEGEQTLLAAKRIKNGIIFAFEPQTFIRARLEENLRLNSIKNARVIPYGLSNRREKVFLYGSEERAEDGSINFGQSTIHKRPGIGKKIEEIELLVLDNFVEREGFQRLDMMKIDVEGAELHVLQGAQNSIDKFRPDIILEVAESTLRAAKTSASEIESFLSARGYNFFLFQKNGKLKSLEKLSEGPGRDVFATTKKISDLMEYM